jgi:hypothetical protein
MTSTARVIGAIAFCFLPMMAVESATADSFSTLRGRVLFTREWAGGTESGPVPSIEVTLSGPALEHPRKTTTNRHGQFLFIALPEGADYRLTVVTAESERGTGTIGTIAASETVYAEAVMRFPVGLGCSALCWHVQRRSPTVTHLFPLPPGPICGICL